MNGGREWPPLHDTGAGGIPPRPGQADEALAEVVRRRRRKAAAATTLVMGILTGWVVYLIMPRNGGGAAEVTTGTSASRPADASASAMTPSTKDRMLEPLHLPMPRSGSPATRPSRAPEPSMLSSTPHRRWRPAAPSTLVPPPSMTFSVEDPAGTPLAGISAYAVGASVTRPIGVSAEDGSMSIECAATAGRPLLFADVAGGAWAWQLTGGTTDLAAATVPPCGSHTTVVLQPASAVTGAYERDGAPGTGAVVGIACADAPALPLTTTVDDRGAYTLRGLAPGTCSLTHTTTSAPCATVAEPTVVLATGDEVVVDILDAGCASPSPSPSMTSAPPPSPSVSPTPPTP
jgi:hypothetical protein